MIQKVLRIGHLDEYALLLTEDEYRMVRDILRGEWIAQDWAGEVGMLDVVRINDGTHFTLEEDDDV